MDEILKRDQNHVTVLAGVTNDSDLDVTMLRVDPITKRLLVKATGGGGGGVSSVIAGTGISVDSTDPSNPIVTNTKVLQFETPTGAVNDSNTSFTVTHTPLYILVNGGQYVVGTGIYSSFGAGTISLSSAVGTGGFIRSAFLA